MALQCWTTSKSTLKIRSLWHDLPELSVNTESPKITDPCKNWHNKENLVLFIKPEVSNQSYKVPSKYCLSTSPETALLSTEHNLDVILKTLTFKVTLSMFLCHNPINDCFPFFYFLTNLTLLEAQHVSQQSKTVITDHHISEKGR